MSQTRSRSLWRRGCTHTHTHTHLRAVQELIWFHCWWIYSDSESPDCRKEIFRFDVFMWIFSNEESAETLSFLCWLFSYIVKVWFKFQHKIFFCLWKFCMNSEAEMLNKACVCCAGNSITAWSKEGLPDAPALFMCIFLWRTFPTRSFFVWINNHIMQSRACAAAAACTAPRCPPVMIQSAAGEISLRQASSSMFDLIPQTFRVQSFATF